MYSVHKVVVELINQAFLFSGNQKPENQFLSVKKQPKEENLELYFHLFD